MKQMSKKLKSFNMINKNIYKIKYQILVILMFLNKKKKTIFLTI